MYALEREQAAYLTLAGLFLEPKAPVKQELTVRWSGTKETVLVYLCGFTATKESKLCVCLGDLDN
jgi:hypothetical protein